MQLTVVSSLEHLLVCADLYCGRCVQLTVRSMWWLFVCGCQCVRVSLHAVVAVVELLLS